MTDTPVDENGLESTGTGEPGRVPVFQQLYNRIWLIALLGTAFFAVTYVGWGLIDVLSAPVR